MVRREVNCDGCDQACRRDVLYVMFDYTLASHDVCGDCLEAMSRTCPLCDMSFTLDCFEDNELVCRFCQEEEDDSDYEPHPLDGESDSNTDSDTDSDLETDSDSEDDDLIR